MTKERLIHFVIVIIVAASVFFLIRRVYSLAAVFLATAISVIDYLT